MAACKSKRGLTRHWIDHKHILFSLETAFFLLQLYLYQTTENHREVKHLLNPTLYLAPAL